MRPLRHRDPGPVLALLEDDRVALELVTGVHGPTCARGSTPGGTAPARRGDGAMAAAAGKTGTCSAARRRRARGRARLAGTARSPAAATPFSLPVRRGPGVDDLNCRVNSGRDEPGPGAPASTVAAGPRRPVVLTRRPRVRGAARRGLGQPPAARTGVDHESVNVAGPDRSDGFTSPMSPGPASSAATAPFSP
jgi:hypothetical protein